MSELDDYLDHAQREMLPKLEGSALVITIGADKPDIKLCLEVGASILLDKPLILMLPKGRQVSANLKRVATVIVEGNMNDPETCDRLRSAIESILANDRRAHS
jgi:hypothetical protein